jgi:hypothetical protein
VLRQVQEQVDDTGRSYKDAAKEVQSFGQVQSALGSLSGTLRGIGLGGLADIVGAGADVSGAVEDLGRVGPALRDAGTTAASALSNITGMSVSVGAVGVAAGVGVIAVGALTLAISELQRQNEEAAKGIEAYISAQQALIDIISDENFTEEQRIALIAAYDKEIRAQTAALNDLQASYNQLTNGLGILTPMAEGVNDRIGTLAGGIDAVQATIADLNIRIAGLRGEEALAAVAANELAIAEQELTAARLKGENAALAAINAAARAADVTAARASYDASIEAMDAAREMARFEEELAGVRKQSRSSGNALTEAARQRVNSLTEQMVQAEATAEKAIAKVQADTAKKRADIEADYMQDALENTRDYLKEEREANEDYNRERIRRVEDLADDLLSAEEDNDVIRFIQAQRAGQKDLRRMDEDATVEAKRRSEEFQAEQAQRKDEAAQRLADLRDDSQERINEIRQGLRDQRRTLDEQIRQEQTALQQRLTLNQRALVAELDTRRKAHALSLQEEAVYGQRRLALQQQLDNALMAISSRSYSGLAIKGGGYSATMSSKSYTRPLTTNSGVNPIFNITMGNIGSNISKSEVQASVIGAVKAFSAATIAGLSGGK